MEFAIVTDVNTKRINIAIRVRMQSLELLRNVVLGSKQHDHLNYVIYLGTTQREGVFVTKFFFRVQEK